MTPSSTPYPAGPPGAHPSDAAVLAVDPGRAKCGLAVVTQGGEVKLRAIVSPEQVFERLMALVQQHAPIAVVVGSGTGCQKFARTLSLESVGAPVEWVDERCTSEEARRRFVLAEPARGWQRLLPRSLRVPDRPYDDYAAVILAERWWAERA